MRNWNRTFLGFIYLAFILRIEARPEYTERISGSAGDVLEDDPVGRLKVCV